MLPNAECAMLNGMQQYLLPILRGGANNQLVGLKEGVPGASVLPAAAFTLLLPPFVCGTQTARWC